MDEFLEIITPAGRQRLPLSDQPVSIGRSPQNVVPIDEAYASRFHCVVERSGSGFQLRDLGSRNGTLLNDQRLSEPVPLSPGDKFSIGQVQFVFNGSAKVARKGKTSPPAATEPRSEREEAELLAASMPTMDLKSEAPVPLNAFSGRRGRAGAGGSAPVTREADADPIAKLRTMAGIGTPEGIDETKVSLISNRGRVIHAAQDLDNDDSESTQAIRTLRLLLLASIRTRASDLHFEPKGDNWLIRMRVDGSMVTALRVPQPIGQRLLSAVKILCDIDISQKSIIQEGHFSSRVPGRTIDYRISFTPAMLGQKLVIRILDLGNAPQFLEDLRMPPWMLNSIRKISRQDSGMVLVCGPTGSGKTTTLYAVLRDVDTEQRNVITIEDPVEYQIEGVTQIPIDEHKGNTFHTLLRSVLRQDPDVILLGEIRDRETADTGMQAAMTGHLVLSTIHAKDTIGTIFRLLDLGVEPYLVASALNLVFAQRLVRKLCPQCKAPRKPTPQQTMRMGGVNKSLKAIYYPVGCINCLNTGYLGRRGLFELLMMSDPLRDVVLKNPTMGAIHEALSRDVFVSLQDMGCQCVASGDTSIEEVDRVVGST